MKELRLSDYITYQSHHLWDLDNEIKRNIRSKITAGHWFLAKFIELQVGYSDGDTHIFLDISIDKLNEHSGVN